MLLENEAALTNTDNIWSVRLGAQDSGFSFLQHGFEFRTDYQKNTTLMDNSGQRGVVEIIIEPLTGAQVLGTKQKGYWVIPFCGFCFLHQLHFLESFKTLNRVRLVLSKSSVGSVYRGIVITVKTGV